MKAFDCWKLFVDGVKEGAETEGLNSVVEVVIFVWNGFKAAASVDAGIDGAITGWEGARMGCCMIGAT